MSKMKKLWDDEAWEEYKQWLVTDKKVVKKINIKIAFFKLSVK